MAEFICPQCKHNELIKETTSVTISESIYFIEDDVETGDIEYINDEDTTEIIYKCGNCDFYLPITVITNEDLLEWVHENCG